MASLKKAVKEEEDSVQRILNELSGLTLERDPSTDRDTVDPGDLMQRIKKHEAHCSWDFKEENPQTTMKELAENLDRKDEESIEAAYQGHWRDFNFAILRAFCFADMDKLGQANQFVAHAKLLAKEDDLQNIYEGLMYVCDVMQAYVYALLDQSEEAYEVLDSIPEYNSLSRVARATVLGLRASALIEMHERGNQLALPFLNQALELDNSYPEWFYMRAKAASRARRMKNPYSICDDSEIRDLEAAVIRSPKPVYRLTLAQVLAEKAKEMRIRKIAARQQEISDLNSQAKELYCLVLKENPNCPRTNVDCANGFLKLPFPHRSYERAESCIKKALELAPTSSKVHHRAATIYEYKPNPTSEDYARAIHHYEKAVELRLDNAVAYIGLVKMKLLVEPNFDPLPCLVEIRQHTKILPELTSVEVVQGLFYWTKSSDAKKAAMAWCEALRIGNDLFKDLFIRMTYHPCFKSAREDSSRLQSSLREVLNNETDCKIKERIAKIIQVLQDIADYKNRRPSTPHSQSSRGSYRGRGQRGYRGPYRGPRRGTPRGRGRE